MGFPEIDDALRLRRLQPPAGEVHMVLDTDTYNEIDDQFAVTYALLSSPKLRVEAIYAAPFFNNRSSGPADGMHKSYEEILRLLERLDRSSRCPVFKGSEGFLPDLASAIMIEPKIIERIVVVWLEAHIKGKSKIGDYLFQVFRDYAEDHFGRAKEIWDISAIAWVIEPEWVLIVLTHSPLLSDRYTWRADDSRHLIRCAVFVQRNPIFRDLFFKIRAHSS